MNCMKCGREIGGENAFCETCLKEMENYPVKPGTVVHIPAHPETQSPKRPQPRKKAPTPEEQIVRLKKRMIRMRVMLATMVLAVLLLCFAVYRMLGELDVYRFLGQNYSTVETQGDATEPSAEVPTETAAQ